MLLLFTRPSEIKRTRKGRETVRQFPRTGSETALPLLTGRRQKTVSWTLLVLFFIASAAIQYKIKFSDVSRVTISGLAEKTAAPDFSLNDLNSERVALEDFRGQTVILDFWATWCGPCRSEFAELRAWWEKSQSRLSGVTLLAVNVGEPASTVRAYVEREKLPFRVLLDPDGSIAERYNVRALPTLYVLDPQGMILKTTVGYQGGTAVMLDLLLEQTRKDKTP